MNLKLAKVKVRIPGRERPLFQVANLDLPAGTQLLIYGPSGQGKTTLLHLLAGLLAPYEGQVLLGETDMGRLTDFERSALRRKHFGIVFQQLNLLEHLTALENVLLGEGGANGAQALARANEALKAVNMAGHATQLSASLSLGERQRVAVARVLGRRPEIVLADEPTSSLDEANANAVIESLLAAAKGRTLIVVSHDERIRKHFAQHRNFAELVQS